MGNDRPVNWEKIGVYIAIMASAITIFNHMADMRERIRALEVKVEKLEGK